MTTASYSTPVSFYDIPPHDYLHMNYTSQLGNNVDIGFGGSYSCTPTGGELAPAYPTYNGLSLFQTPPSLLNTSSESSVAPSQSSVYAQSPSPGSLSGDLTSQPILESGTDAKEVKPAAAQVGKRKRRRNSVGRLGDKAKRPSGTGYSTMFERLPKDIQQKLEKTYDCCKAIDKKDMSTLRKHWFSNRHFEMAVGKERLDAQPTFACPAFLSMHSLCKTAKAGRYDSSDRHCDKCEGFMAIQKVCEESKVEVTVAPVQLKLGEFKAIQRFRKNSRQGRQEPYSEPILNAVFKLLVMMAVGETVDSPESESEISGSADKDAVTFDVDEMLAMFSSDELEDGDGDGVNHAFSV